LAEVHDNNIIVKAENIHLSFGGATALAGVSFNLFQNEVLAIIGPNGAGKTSVLNCLSGFYKPQQGNIYINNKKINKLATHKIAKMGVARTFQNTALYTGLSALENLLVARHFFYKYNVFAGAIHFGRALKEELYQQKKAEEIMEFLEIKNLKNQTVSTLPFGLCKMVEFGRALAMEPKVLLLDEPMAGMSHKEKVNMSMYIKNVFQTKGIPIILVEHDMGIVMKIAHRIIVFDFGEVIAEGPPEKIQKSPKVIQSYLGKQS
jgi:branched-chain amino acid transport system ATP-binding protein